MRPLAINLASRPFYNTTLYLVAYAVSLGFLVVMTGLNLYTFTADQLAMNRVNHARGQLEREMSDLDRQEANLRRDLRRINLVALNKQSRFASRAILSRVFSWTLLFNRLEEILPPNVKLRSIRPNVQESQINLRVVGVAKHAGAVTDFEEALIQSPLFADVYPNSEILSPEQRGINFDLQFRYLPAIEELVTEELEVTEARGGDGPLTAALTGEGPDGGRP